MRFSYGSIFSALPVTNNRKQNQFFMRSILYIIAVILIIGWLLGLFAWHAGNLIHILIVLAVIALLLGIIRRA
jgi:cobalamin synthase